MSERQKVVLITGGGGALGGAAGRAFAQRGYRAVLIDASEERARAAAAALQRDRLSALALTADVTDAAAVRSLVESIAAEHGGIDVLVNMAGIVRNAALGKITAEDLELTMRTHVTGTFNCMQAAVPAMRALGYGRIVNISSVAALGSVGGGAYGAAKGAIESLSRAAALELAPRGITVNCVAPGLIAAGMFLTTEKHFQEAGIARIPMKRAGTAEEVAQCIAFLGSPEASYVTGQTLFVCGGLSTGF